MVHIKSIITFVFAICFLGISTIFIILWNKDIEFYNTKSFNHIIESNYKLSIERIEKSDEQLCSIIETIRTSLAKKTINTTDRVLLNLFFTTILQKNRFIKSFELVLPNKFEYRIFPISSGWKTITLTPGDRGFIKKEAIWTEDGTQLLDEEIEEVGPEQSITNSEWYKESVSLCLQQDMQNREGIPKIKFTPPEISEVGPSINSRMAMAIGYEDSPFSVISWELDWTWLQNTISDIYRDYSVYVYVISDKYVICKLGMEGASNRDILKSVSLQNLPDEVKNLISNKKNITTPQFQKKTNGVLVFQKYVFAYSTPLICIFDIPCDLSSKTLKQNIIILFIICFLGIIIVAFSMGHAITKPLKEISHWLENPKVEEQKSPLHFWIIEYETLMNKIYSILYFWKFWITDIKEGNIEEKKREDRTEQEAFIFSEEGKGGIPIETVNRLYRENIRLQRQIESLNQYYLKKIDTDTKEKIKSQSFIVALRDSILISKDKNRTKQEKIKNILEITQNTLKTENTSIWEIEKGGEILNLLYMTPENKKVNHLNDCQFVIEALKWAETLAIKSAQQDYRSHLWKKLLDAESFIFASIRSDKEESLDYIFLTCSNEFRNWETNDENFVIIISKVLCEIIKNGERTE